MNPGPGIGHRTGWGFDAHRLDGDPPLILGGVVVSDSVGVSATSDGDVLAHALADALLGAAALGDIGEHFPSDEPANLGIDSMRLLRRVRQMAAEAGLVPTHVDVTVISGTVKIGPHRQLIREGVAASLEIAPEAVSVKATSTDGLGFVGRDEGIAVAALASMGPASEPA